MTPAERVRRAVAAMERDGVPRYRGALVSDLRAVLAELDAAREEIAALRRNAALHPRDRQEFGL